MTRDLQQWTSELMQLDIPFKPLGRDRSGLDCWGVVWMAYRECFGVELPSYTDEYAPDDFSDYERIGELVGKYLPGWSLCDSPRAGDVVLMRLRGRPIHVGLVIMPGSMLHIEENTRLCVESYERSVWKNRIVGIYRYSLAA